MPGKKTKDPNAPKRPLSAYFIFAGDTRKGVVAEHPSWKIGEVAKELGRQWRTLDNIQKEPYVTRAAALRSQYQKDMEVYRNRKSASSQ